MLLTMIIEVDDFVNLIKFLEKQYCAASILRPHATEVVAWVCAPWSKEKLPDVAHDNDDSWWCCPGSTTSTCLMFVFPGIFYLKLSNQPLHSAESVGVSTHLSPAVIKQHLHNTSLDIFSHKGSQYGDTVCSFNYRIITYIYIFRIFKSIVC